MDAVTLTAIIAAALAVGAVVGDVLLRRRRWRSREFEIGSASIKLEASAGSPERPTSPPEVDPPRPPAELIRALATAECVLFAGAGLPAQAGYPTFRAMLTAVLDAHSAEFPDNVEDALRRQLDSGEPELAGETIRAAIGDAAFQATVQSALTRVERRSSRALLDLPRLPFAGVVTDDWTGEIARRFYTPDVVTLTPSTESAGTELVRGKRPFVIEAYGSAEKGVLLIGGDDYRAWLERDPSYARILGSILTTRSMLFLGTSVAGIEEFMRTAEVPPGRHFALVPATPDVVLRAERLQRRYGVELLIYAPDDHHAAVAAFVRELRDRVPPGARGMAASATEAEPVREIRLRNIGPFSDLTVPLGSRRTILLGDNGSGKSSILRAIALALVGESPEASRLAQRMLTSGEREGSVELRVGRATYASRLVSDAGRVRVRAPQLTPIQAGAWLAIGFPPLRGVSLTNPAGPTTTGVRDPEQEDLLPVLSDRPDDRLDSLKQWIVNTWLRAEEDPSASRMLDRFFVIVRELTPGVDFEFRGVDRETWTVKLHSPADGALSFDLLSRGMTTILGWIGVLLQRLYETHGADPEPERQQALVLVDEIDVHLHPEWQRRILPLLKEHFPGLQLIATTHSPLVVGSAEVGEVMHLREDRTLAPVMEDFAGWRSDQILTSEAFDMETTRDTDTERDHVEYRDLLARGETPARNQRAAHLAERLSEASPGEEESPAERAAARLFREWLYDRLRNASDPERARLIGEAEAYLARLQGGR